ncbi:hypothetical protein [Streptomyces sp. NPDC003863]
MTTAAVTPAITLNSGIKILQPGFIASRVHHDEPTAAVTAVPATGHSSSDAASIYGTETDVRPSIAQVRWPLRAQIEISPACIGALGTIPQSLTLINATTSTVAWCGSTA